MDAKLNQFAVRYAEAWCSQDPEKVIAFYAKNALISVNNGPPATIEEVARGFMADFPDMIVTFDKLEARDDKVAFHWTLTGTYSETGNKIQISGHELWKIDSNGLIAESQGHFDAADYERQIRGQRHVT